MSLADLFDGMEKAQSNPSADFFKSGNYTVSPKSFEYRDGYKGKSFIARFVVDKSNNPEVPEGSTRSWIVKLDGKKDQKERNVGDIKNLFFALQGLEPSKVPSFEKDPKVHKETFALWMASIDSSYAHEHNLDGTVFLGMPVNLEVATKTYTKKNSDEEAEWTNHFWSPTPDALAN